MDELSAILEAVGEEESEKIPADELKSIKYLMSKFMFNVTGTAVIKQISSPVMADTIHEIVKEGNVSTAEFLIILYLLEDMNDSQWQKMWCDVIRDKKRSGFVLECFIERLWFLAHTKALDDDQSKRLITVVEEIEKRLDWTNERKDAVLQTIRNATVIAALKG